MKGVLIISMKQDRKFLVVILIIAVFYLFSCGKNYYRFENVNYESSEAAIEAQKRIIDLFLSKITATNTPVGGTLIAILPSDTYIEQNFIIYKGELNEERKKKASQFLTLAIKNEYIKYIQAVEKRRIFDKVIYTFSDDPEDVRFNEDFALIVLKKDGQSKWFLKKNNDQSSLKPIEEISPALPPVHSLNLWLNSVEETARSP